MEWGSKRVMWIYIILSQRKLWWRCFIQYINHTKENDDPLLYYFLSVSKFKPVVGWSNQNENKKRKKREIEKIDWKQEFPTNNSGK